MSWPGGQVVEDCRCRRERAGLERWLPRPRAPVMSTFMSELHGRRGLLRPRARIGGPGRAKPVDQRAPELAHGRRRERRAEAVTRPRAPARASEPRKRRRRCRARELAHAPVLAHVLAEDDAGGAEGGDLVHTTYARSQSRRRPASARRCGQGVVDNTERAAQGRDQQRQGPCNTEAPPPRHPPDRGVERVQRAGGLRSAPGIAAAEAQEDVAGSRTPGAIAELLAEDA